MDIGNQYGTLEMQKRLVRLLESFHRFAIENNIKYSLDWGSLLGAVRHKGFIPWDDDLDIMVDRENYNKILKHIGGDLLIKHNTKEWLWIDRIQFKDTDVDWKIPPTLDIFIIDNIPDSSISRKIQIYGILFITGMMKGWPQKGNLFQRFALSIAHLFGLCIPWKTKMEWFHRFSQRWNNIETEKKASYNTVYEDLSKVYSAEILDEVIEAPFENTVAFITKDYHNSLVAKFGPDYMTPIYRAPIHIGKS